MCDREEYISRRIDDLRQSYYDLSRPYIKMKARIYDLSLPEIIISDKGTEVKYNFTKQQQETINQIDEILTDIQLKTEKQMQELFR